LEVKGESANAILSVPLSYIEYKPDCQPRIVMGRRMSFRPVSQLEGWLVIEHEVVRKMREKREK
jgi:hypothetical protein